MTFPIPLNALHGAAFAIASRIYNEESLEGVISEQNLKKLINKTDKFKGFLKKFDIKDPSKIAGLVEDYLEDRYDEMHVEETIVDKTQVAKDWLEENVEGFKEDGYISPATSRTKEFVHLGWYGTKQNEKNIVKEKIDFCDTDHYTLMRMYDPDDQRFDIFILNEHDSDDGERIRTSFRKYESSCTLYLKDKDYESLNENTVWDYCWGQLDNEIRLNLRSEYSDGTSEVSVVNERGQKDVPEYKGPLEKETERIKTFHKHDYSANIMLYGQPGTGKSCFCQNFAKENDYKTLRVPISVMRNGCSIDFSDMIAATQPELVIVDDFDSIWEGADIEDKGPLEKVNMLNEFNATTIFTVNNVELLPDAIKRPGRIDRIVNAECSNRDERETVQEHLANLVGIEIEQEYEDKIDEFHQKYSPAHLKHLYKQVKIFGWGEQIRWEYPYQEYK
jgi:hypothetical protein